METRASKPCECGCGQPTKPTIHTRGGLKKGEPHRFVLGHSSRTSMAPRRSSKGYVKVREPEHPRAEGGRVYEHILVAERALGKCLRLPAQVHHVNENKADNRPGNLVICQDRAYHALLHQRLRSLRACGNPNWRPCGHCREYDDTACMAGLGKGAIHGYAHKACIADYQRKWKRAKRRRAVA